MRVKRAVRKGQLVTNKDVVELTDRNIMHATQVPTQASFNVSNEKIDHPAHYGGRDNPYEAIKVIEAWGVGFHIGNTLKYLSRMGKKSTESSLQDASKAKWYLDRYIKLLESGKIEK